MDLEVSIFSEKKENGPRYWVRISTPEQDDKGNTLNTYINASLLCNMSKNARDAYDEHAEVTNNPEVRKLRCKVTSGWFKAIKTNSVKDGAFNGTAPVLFVNGIGPAIPRRPKNSDW